MLLPKTYTPPPTAPALHPTCAISAPPPYLTIIDPNPEPNIPMERKCRLIRVMADCASVTSAGSNDSDNASNGWWRDEGILNWEDRTSAIDFASGTVVPEFSVSGFSCNTCLKNFMMDRLSRLEIVLSENTSSRPLGIFCNISFHCPLWPPDCPMSETSDLVELSSLKVHHEQTAWNSSCS